MNLLPLSHLGPGVVLARLTMSKVSLFAEAVCSMYAVWPLLEFLFLYAHLYEVLLRVHVSHDEKDEERD